MKPKIIGLSIITIVVIVVIIAMLVNFDLVKIEDMKQIIDMFSSMPE